MSTTVTRLPVMLKDGYGPPTREVLELEPDEVEKLEALPARESPLSVLVCSRGGHRFLLRREWSGLANNYVLHAERVPG